MGRRLFVPAFVLYVACLPLTSLILIRACSAPDSGAGKTPAEFHLHKAKHTALTKRARLRTPPWQATDEMLWWSVIALRRRCCSCSQFSSYKSALASSAGRPVAPRAHHGTPRAEPTLCARVGRARHSERLCFLALLVSFIRLPRGCTCMLHENGQSLSEVSSSGLRCWCP